MKRAIILAMQSKVGAIMSLWLFMGSSRYLRCYFISGFDLTWSGLHMGEWLQLILQQTMFVVGWSPFPPSGWFPYRQTKNDSFDKDMCGSGVEELLKFSGLSASVQRVFHNYGQYRPNRRFMLQVLAAMVSHLEYSFNSIPSTFALEGSECLGEVAKEDGFSEEENHRV